jgi:catechol 2,3-dioxygenase-like lactoylglutathione lyase family enzyme
MSAVERQMGGSVKSTATVAPTFEAVTPRLPVGDIEKLLGFYVDELGFDLGWKWGAPVTHANVCRGSVSFDLISMPPERQGTAMAYVRVSDIDVYYAELKARSVEVTALEDRSYGMRDFEVVDPCGNRIAFGQPMVV